MTLELLFSSHAVRDLRRLPADIREAFLHELRLLATDPHGRHPKAKALKGDPPTFRLRIGDYRAVYAIEREAGVVVVARVGHRREVYR